MKINPDDPWYPFVIDSDGCRGVPIRLKLAAEMMKSPYLVPACRPPSHPMMEAGEVPTADVVIEAAVTLADRLIDRANRDEGEAG